MLMSAVEIRTEIDQLLNKIQSNNESFLKVVHSMLTTYVQEQDPVIGYNAAGKPMYASVAKEEFKARHEAVDRGEFITLEELKKESETWLQKTPLCNRQSL